MMACICITALASAGADMYNQAFDQANAAYNAGNYQAAIDAYEQLVAESVVHPAVFFNLANAYYRSGCLGAAIANYERTLQLDPRAEDARENLDRCVRESAQHLARPRPPDWEQSLLFWHYDLPPRATRVAAGVSWFTFWLLLAMRLVRPVRFLRHGAVAVGLLAVAFGLSAWTKAHADLYAVAVDEKVPVHYGTSEDETVRFYLYAGDRVLVDRREKGWARIMTADDERGWVKEDALALVGPPYERPRPPRPAAGEPGGAS